MTALEGIVYDLPDAAYHSRPELSSTQARQILDSPAKYKEALTHPEAHKDAFDLGSAVHTKVLGTGSKVITYPEEHLTPSGNISTSKATVAWVTQQNAEGIAVVSPKQLADVDGMAEAVLAHPEARLLIEQTVHREVSLFTTDPMTGVDIRARFDLYGDECGDLKSARDASPHGFEKATKEHRYDIQQEHYLKARALVVGDRPRFRFIAVEPTRPYLVGVYILNEQWQEIGDVWAKAAREIYRLCTDANDWPGYSKETYELAPPMGLIYEHQDRFAAEEMRF